jgi:hypothetical protein
MPIKFSYDKIDDVPEPLREHYEEKDGRFVLKAEGAVAKANADELRQNNIRLANELRTFQERFDGIDPDEVRSMLEEKQKREEDKIKDKEKFEAALKTRLGPVQTQLEKERTRSKALEAQLSDLLIMQSAANAGRQKKIRPEAVEDLTERVKKVFRIQEGKVVATDAAGNAIMNASGEPLSVVEFVDDLATKAPHLFEASSGTGARGSGMTGNVTGFDGTNPFKKESWNMTRQGEIYKKNPALAARLKAEAGIKY